MHRAGRQVGLIDIDARIPSRDRGRIGPVGVGREVHDGPDAGGNRHGDVVQPFAAVIAAIPIGIQIDGAGEGAGE